MDPITKWITACMAIPALKCTMKNIPTAMRELFPVSIRRWTSPVGSNIPILALLSSITSLIGRVSISWLQICFGSIQREPIWDKPILNLQKRERHKLNVLNLQYILLCIKVVSFSYELSLTVNPFFRSRPSRPMLIP